MELLCLRPIKFMSNNGILQIVLRFWIWNWIIIGYHGSIATHQVGTNIVSLTEHNHRVLLT